jgi:glutamate racemase
MSKYKIGVFDSGVGGMSVVNAIKRRLPDLVIIYKDDKAHVPYGDRNVEEIYTFVKPVMQQFIDEGCQVIVIACNTVTTNLIQRLRTDFDVPFVGMEPAIKPAAAASQTGVIAVCATPRTLTSDRYKYLKAEYAKDIKVIEPDCSDWAAMIEANNVDKLKVAGIVESVCAADADEIVLGCTHYHWIEEFIKQKVDGRAEVIQPTEPVINQLRTALSQLA